MRAGKKIRTSQGKRGWNGTSAPPRMRRPFRRARGTVDGFWFLTVPLIVRHQHAAFNPGDPEMSAEVGKVERADGARDYKEVNLIRPGQQDGYIADRVIFKANPEIGDSRAPILGMVIHQLLPARGMVGRLLGIRHLACQAGQDDCQKKRDSFIERASPNQAEFCSTQDYQHLGEQNPGSGSFLRKKAPPHSSCSWGSRRRFLSRARLRSDKN